MLDPRRRLWIEIAAISAVSYILYQFNVFILFLIPLQILYARRGSTELVRGAGIVFLLTALTAVKRLAGLDDASLRRMLLVLEVVLPFSLLAGIVLPAINWSFYPEGRRLIKLGGVTALIGIVSVPVVLMVSRNDGLGRFFVDQIEAFRAALEASSEGDPTLMYAFAEILGDPERLATMAAELLLRNYLFSFFILVGGSIWIGDFAASRTSVGIEYPRIRSFRVPEKTLWLVVLSWGIVLVDSVSNSGVGAIRYAAWNVGMTALLMYGIQGVGIIRHVLVKRKVSRFIRISFGILVFLMLFWPGANLVVLIGIPGVGISETWVRYRVQSKE